MPPNTTIVLQGECHFPISYIPTTSMNKLSVLLSLSAAAYFPVAVLANNPAPAGQVCFYLQANYQGHRKCFLSGTEGNLCDSQHGGCGGAWNDKVRSILFGTGVSEIEIFRHSGFEERYTTFQASQPDLASAYHDFTSFRIDQSVRDDQVCFFLRASYEGQRKCFNQHQSGNFCDEAHGGCHGAWNDKVRSIKLGANIQEVEIFRHNHYVDRLTTFTTSQSTLQSNYRDFTAFTIDPNPPGVVCFYLGTNYEKARKCFRQGESGNFCDSKYGGCSGNWNDKIRSIRLGEGVTGVELFRDSGFKVPLTTLTSSHAVLSTGYHGLTSFKIAPAPTPVPSTTPAPTAAAVIETPAPATPAPETPAPETPAPTTEAPAASVDGGMESLDSNAYQSTTAPPTAGCRLRHRRRV